LILLAFITGNSSLEPMLEGLFAQIPIDLSSRIFGRNRTGDLRLYGQRATLSVNYKPGDWDSVRAWILKAESGWYQAETAEDPQNMNKFAAGSLGAVTAHRIKWILSGRSAGQQIRQWQQA